ncbi:MAG: hypothetical protein E7Z84_03125 [Methanosphaera stadtmanae]|nr:hypothetical protein [Methanosphaera stadtmanae]
MAISKDSLISVVGVCGINGNLIARILMDHGYNVQANDKVNKEDCKFIDSLKNYPDMTIYYGQIPESFFTTADYMILPEALNQKSMIYQKVMNYGIPLISVQNILDMFEPVHPVICITGTNGKSTTTNLLKKIAYECGMKPCEHNLKGMQGNLAYIPALQARLNGDLSILETGTFGQVGDLKKLATPCKPDAGLITNITQDHLKEGNTFIDYALIKGELVELLNNKTLVVNNDDPTIKGLLNKLNYQGNLITFGLETESTRKSTKTCFCGKEIEINEFIAGVGKYECSCGIKYEQPDYLAYKINNTHDSFILKTPDGNEYSFNLAISGIHNIYNAVGSIILAHEIMGISYEKLQKSVPKFTGVKGRMEKLFVKNNKQIMIDYAHNPAGITTVLKELKTKYSKVIDVITTSSESGISGDREILECAAEYADYIVPASENAYKCAKQVLEEGLYENKIVLPDTMPEGHKTGTLGASTEQVLVAYEKALTIDADLLVCTGEAAFKYKDLFN